MRSASGTRSRSCKGGHQRVMTVEITSQCSDSIVVTISVVEEHDSDEEHYSMAGRHLVNMGVDGAAERVALQLPPRRAASENAKIAPISRAEGGQLQAPVGRADSLRGDPLHASR